MKCLLLALALVCAVQATAVPQATKDLDIQKLAGSWHSMAMAASDIALLDSRDAPMRVFVKELRPITPSSLEITQSRWENGKCVEKKILATKTDATAAEFQINNQDATKLYVMDATPEAMVVCMEATKAAPQKDVACQYLAKKPDAKQERVMEKLFSSLRGLPVSMWMYFSPAQAQEHCWV